MPKGEGRGEERIWVGRMGSLGEGETERGLLWGARGRGGEGRRGLGRWVGRAIMFGRKGVPHPHPPACLEDVMA